jgi:hypothetical protein
MLKTVLEETNLRTNAVGFKLFCIFAALADKIVDLEKHLDTDDFDGRKHLPVGQKLSLQLQRAKALFYMCTVFSLKIASGFGALGGEHTLRRRYQRTWVGGGGGGGPARNKSPQCCLALV